MFTLHYSVSNDDNNDNTQTNYQVITNIKPTFSLIKINIVRYYFFVI